MTEWILLAVALLLVAACGVFVAAEFAFVTVDRSKVDQAVADGEPGALGVQTALRSLSTQLSGAQVGITVTNLAIGFLAEPAIAELIDGPLAATGLGERAVHPIAIAIALALSTALTMIFGELVPKNLAIARPMETARATQWFQRGFTASMAIPIRGLNGSANALVRRLGIEPQEELRSARSSTELASLMQRSADQGTLDVETAELMERSVEFGTRTAGEIMTPRVRTTSVEETERASLVIELARQTGHSRFPVLDAEENVVGTVHVKNAVALPVHERATTRVKHIMAKPIVVPDSLRLDPLLAILREDGFQMAIVLDEYGGQAGIVTLEDVVEEIVGDIADEHDRLGARARQRRDGSWSLSGLLRPDEVEDVTGIELPEDEDYDTIAGLVLSVLGRVPHGRRRRRGAGADRSDPEESARAAGRAHGPPHGRSPDRPRGAAAPRRLRPADSSDRRRSPHEHLGRPGPGRVPAGGQRLLRRRRVRADLGPPQPDRAPRAGRAPGWRGPPCARMENISLVMAGAQLGITICSLGLGAVGEPAVAHLLEPVFHALHVPDGLLHPVSFVVALVVVVYLHVVLGEMVPKNIAIAGPERAAILLGPPMMAIVTVLGPGDRRAQRDRQRHAATDADRAARTRSARRTPARRSPPWSRSRGARACSRTRSTTGSPVRSASRRRPSRAC